MKMINPPRYFIYDGRYRFDEESALVMDMENSLDEARRMAPEYGDAVIVDSKTGEIVE
jgi:hypothetical protein